MACGDVLSLEDLQTAKKHQIFEAEVITGKAGGVAGGADIATATNQVTWQVQTTLPETLRQLGFKPASFTFVTGGTLAVGDHDKAVYNPAPNGDNNWYAWGGTLPKTVPAGSTPQTTGGFGANAWTAKTDPSLRADLASSEQGKGAALVGYKRKALTTFVQSAQAMMDAQWVNVWEFADAITSKPNPTDPNTWDWTPAFQAAINFIGHAALAPSVSGGCLVIPPVAKNSVYKITEIEIPIDMAIFAYGSTIAPVNQAQTRTHLFKFMGMNKVAGLQLWMDFSTTYRGAIWCRGRNIDFTSCAVWFAGNAVTVGDPNWLLNPADGSLGDSEISFTNCQFNWCLRTCMAYGQNSIITFGGGSRCYANRGSIPAGHPNETAWAAAPMGNFVNYGALIYIVGSFLSTFERDIPTLTARVMPVSQAEYVHSFGRFLISGTHIETAFLLYAPSESTVSLDNFSKGLVLDNCHGHIAVSLADNHWISASAQYKQGIDIRSCGFYGSAGVTPTRTKLISAPEAQVHATKDNFINVVAGEFKDANITHYPVDVSNVMLANASGANQTVSGTAAPLIMPNNGIIDLHNNSRGYYYTAGTGMFTASVELRNIELTVDVRYVTPVSTNTTSIDLMVDGAIADTVVMTGGYPRGTLRARRIPKGSTFYVRVYGAASYALDGSAGNKFSLIASV